MNLTIANNRFRMDDLGLRKEPTDPGACAPGSVASGIQFASDHATGLWRCWKLAFDPRERTA